MEGVAYALGNPAELPAEIRRACVMIALDVSTSNGTFRVSRRTDALYPVTVTGMRPEQDALLIDNAKTWSEWSGGSPG